MLPLFQLPNFALSMKTLASVLIFGITFAPLPVALLIHTMLPGLGRGPLAGIALATGVAFFLAARQAWNKHRETRAPRASDLSALTGKSL